MCSTYSYCATAYFAISAIKLQRYCQPHNLFYCCSASTPLSAKFTCSVIVLCATALLSTLVLPLRIYATANSTYSCKYTTALLRTSHFLLFCCCATASINFFTAAPLLRLSLSNSHPHYCQLHNCLILSTVLLPTWYFVFTTYLQYCQLYKFLFVCYNVILAT